MDEFDPSTAPADGREATGGRGAVTAPPRPAPAAVPDPVRDGTPAFPVPAARAAAPPSTFDPNHRSGPLLAVEISRPAGIAPVASPSAEPPQFPMVPGIAARALPELAHAKPALVPRPVLEVPPGGRPPAASTARPLGTPSWPRVWHWARRALVYGTIAFVAWFAAVIVSIAAFRYVDPPSSNLMLLQRLSGEVLVQKWLPIERMPAQVIRAIVVSEDGRFCEHGGIDLKAIEVAIETAKDGTPRGASTITMQVAKNLYLWPSKSYVRKALEVPITLAIEAMWSKRRIFEVYANIAEWGPGVFGIEAAAGYHFGKSAGRLSEREAALLAVALPNPVTRDAGDPGPGTERLANTIQSRMRAQSRAAACIERPRRT